MLFLFFLFLSGYLYFAWQMPEGTSWRWWWYAGGAFPFIASLFRWRETEEKQRRLWFYYGVSFPIMGLLLWSAVTHGEIPRYGIETLLAGCLVLIVDEGEYYHL